MRWKVLTVTMDNGIATIKIPAKIWEEITRLIANGGHSLHKETKDFWLDFYASEAFISVHIRDKLSLNGITLSFDRQNFVV